MRKFLIIIICLTIFYYSGNAQTTYTKETLPYIELTGLAEEEITPDEIFITIKLKENNKIPIEKQENLLKTKLKDVGIDLQNLTLLNAYADYTKINILQKDVVAAKSYVLKVANTETIRKVFTLLKSIDVSDAFISKISHSQIDDIRKKIRINAIKDAKEKADYILGAIGQKSGKPIQIIERELRESGGDYDLPYAHTSYRYNSNEKVPKNWNSIN